MSTLLPIDCGRTVLRRFADSDLIHFQAYRTDPEVAVYQSWEPMTDNEALSFIRDVSRSELLVPGHWSQIAIADVSSGVLIGDIGIHVDSASQQAEIGFTVAREFQGQGLAKESVKEAIKLIFNHTAVDKVLGITDARNEASIHLLLALGMDKEKTMETVFRGEPCTEIAFALTRSQVGQSHH